MSKTDIVVLSACETGLGDVMAGEGVFGLQRAFQIAGAKAVIMSLWKVDDEATKQLMVNFYKNWLSTGDLDKSFNMAQKTVRGNFNHPYYWGSFVLMRN
jgi:CHAT domain-containing protein